LLTRSGYECLHASTIADAERILAESLPSAAIIDLRLPDGSGLNLIDRLQKDLKTSSVPVVVMTGSDEVSLGNRKTIIEWLHKPFEDEQLLNAVKKAVSGAKPSTVLIVDDDASTRSVIARQISSLGVVCVEASDGAEAIAMARKHNPDLIVLDVLMPRPDGFEVVDILRQQGIENTRLIVYTAKDLSEQDKRALTLGMTKYISKASRSDTEFLGAVKELLGSSFNPPPTLSG
jgi:CheY-like chemotaxis protein